MMTVGRDADADPVIGTFCLGAISPVAFMDDDPRRIERERAVEAGIMRSSTSR
jgi:hypothetical protein